MNKEARKPHPTIKCWSRFIEGTSDSNKSDDIKDEIFSPRKNSVFGRNLTDVSKKEIKSVDATEENTTSSK
jgi:hypothetical protein